MRDERYDPYGEDAVVEGWAAEHLPPLKPVTTDELGPDVVQPRDAVAAAEQIAFYGADQVESIRRDLPKPPPAELGFDPVKWQRMTRAERRAVTRYAKGKR